MSCICSKAGGQVSYFEGEGGERESVAGAVDKPCEALEAAGCACVCGAVANLQM
jgi:hypothetical protein